MSGPEYILGLLTIISGLAIADLATALHRLLRARRRVLWDALPLVAASLAGLIVVISWWLNWDLRANKAYNPQLWEFCLLVVEMTLMFLMACAALPDEAPPGAIDLRAFYEGESRYFWSLFALLMSFFLMHNVVAPSLRTDDLPALWTGLGVVGGMLALGLVLALWRNRRVHLIVAPVLLVATAGYNLRFQLT